MRCVFLFLLGCSAEAAEADRSSIVRGVRDKGDPAVVMLDIGGTSMCTGSLIGPRSVLTARHCVARTVDRVDCPGHHVLGERDARSITVIVEERGVKTPRARGAKIRVPDGDSLCEADIAVLDLDRTIDVEPLEIARDPPARGQMLRAVGFGKTSDRGKSGTKRARDDVPILEVLSHEIVVGEATCRGDSGGPALDEDGRIVGVVSRGTTSCMGDRARGIYTRVDVYRSLIER